LYSEPCSGITIMGKNALKTVFRLFLLVLTLQSLFAQVPKVKTGIEVLRARDFDILQGKRVGLITNPTGADARLVSTIDILFNARGVKLVALFGPEHGVRGDFAAGDKVDSNTDARTGLPVFSLYGKTRKPTVEMLRNLDVLVYDIQDIGCRSYTYISTMGLAMEAAAENGIPFVVLDRPNPLGGLKVEGNLVENGFESFVSQFRIPYVYGLTCGELATMLNEESMLKGHVRCDLTVVPMEGWRRSMGFEQTGLPWVPASAHIPMESSPKYYVSTGILGELDAMSIGIGTMIPFRILAASWIDPYRMTDLMDSLHLDGVLFRPITFKPFYGQFKDSTLHGVQIQITDPERVNLMSIQYLFMQVHHSLYPLKNPFLLADSSRFSMFDKVSGTDEIRKRFSAGMRYDNIKVYLERDVEGFKRRSEKYYLYR
jgi:uncharacterized protein YbbC (DUF1343 family)